MRQINKLYIIPLLFVSFFLHPLAKSYAQESQPFLGQVNADNINIRSDSTVTSEIICKLNKGDLVEVILESYDWYKIKLPKSAPSYIKSNLVILIDEKTANASTTLTMALKQSRSAKALKDRVNIRLHPNESSTILGMVNKDEVISILENNQEWYRIEPVNNSFAWIHKNFVSKVPVEEVPRDEIQKNTVVLSEMTPEELTVTVEGIIRPYGKVFKRQGTHKLINQENKVFLLKGNRQILDILNYQKVKVTGKLITNSKEKYPIIEIDKITSEE